jgi:hypothetical protein
MRYCREIFREISISVIVTNTKCIDRVEKRKNRKEKYVTFKNVKQEEIESRCIISKYVDGASPDPSRQETDAVIFCLLILHYSKLFRVHFQVRLSPLRPILPIRCISLEGGIRLTTSGRSPTRLYLSTCHSIPSVAQFHRFDHVVALHKLK